MLCRKIWLSLLLFGSFHSQSFAGLGKALQNFAGTITSLTAALRSAPSTGSRFEQQYAPPPGSEVVKEEKHRKEKLREEERQRRQKEQEEEQRLRQEEEKRALEEQKRKQEIKRKEEEREQQKLWLQRKQEELAPRQEEEEQIMPKSPKIETPVARQIAVTTFQSKGQSSQQGFFNSGPQVGQSTATQANKKFSLYAKAPMNGEIFFSSESLKAATKKGKYPPETFLLADSLTEEQVKIIEKNIEIVNNYLSKDTSPSGRDKSYDFKPIIIIRRVSSPQYKTYLYLFYSNRGCPVEIPRLDKKLFYKLPETGLCHFNNQDEYAYAVTIDNDFVFELPHLNATGTNQGGAIDIRELYIQDNNGKVCKKWVVPATGIHTFNLETN